NIQQAKRDLTQLKDELRVKLHLAKKDAETAWKELEPRIGVLEKKLDDAANAVGDKAKQQLAEIKAQWPGLEKAIEQVSNDVKKGAGDLSTQIDMAKVKAHLAAMDTADLREAGKKVAHDLEHAAKEIQTTFEGFAKKLFKKDK